MWRTRRRAETLVAVCLALTTAGALPAIAADDKDAPAKKAADEAALRKEAMRLNDVTGNGATLGAAIGLAKEPAHAKQVLATALRMVREADKDKQPFQINATLVLALTAQELREFEPAEVFWRLQIDQTVLLKDAYGMGRSYLGLASVYEDARKHQECEKVCHELLDLPTNDDAQPPLAAQYYMLEMQYFKRKAQQKIAIALARQGKVSDAIKVAETLVSKDPENWEAQLLKGRLHQEAGEYEAAVRTYKDLLERVPKLKSLEDEKKDQLTKDVQYVLSGVYVDLNQIDKAAELLKALLGQEPDNTTYNNDLGYIWADHDMNLAEAERLIRKALADELTQRKKEQPDIKPAENKNTAAYLDSLGWVLYKQKKYQEAKKFLLQAVEDEEGRHLEIYDHLGDVYNALGERSKAVESWEKGLKVGPNTKRDQQRKVGVEKKLKDTRSAAK